MVKRSPTKRKASEHSDAPVVKREDQYISIRTAWGGARPKTTVSAALGTPPASSPDRSGPTRPSVAKLIRETTDELEVHHRATVAVVHVLRDQQIIAHMQSVCH